MKIQTEPIGSIPRPIALILGIKANAAGQLSGQDLNLLFEDALTDTISRFKETGSPVITDGEQTKPSFVTYPISGMKQLDPNGVVIPFADGHTRQLPHITAGPFHYQIYADSYLKKAKQLTPLPVKQAVIAVSALSLLYPQTTIEGYSREQFIKDLLDEGEADIRRCLDAGAWAVQIDFTEARLSLKLDPSGGLLQSFIDLNNQVITTLPTVQTLAMPTFCRNCLSCMPAVFTWNLQEKRISNRSSVLFKKIAGLTKRFIWE